MIKLNKIRKLIWGKLKIFGKYLVNILYTIWLKFELIMIRIGVGMHIADEDIFKANPNSITEKDKKIQKVRTKNPLLLKMEEGERDEQFVNDYYEILKKADKFILDATPKQFELVADKHGMSIGKSDDELINIGRKSIKEKKDRWGRRYDHFGFFDPKSKHYGKTMREVIVEEVKERTTNDDDYPIEFMFSNQPVNVGYTNNEYIVEDEKLGFRELNPFEKAKKVKPPLIVDRDNLDCKNKIEQLTEYVHVKKIDKIEKVIEFFIPSKYGVFDYDVESDIFQEIININSIWMKDDYGKRIGYGITNYHKRVEVLDKTVKDDTVVVYHVIKLRGNIINNL